jgi:hypothetical protein
MTNQLSAWYLQDNCPNLRRFFTMGKIRLNNALGEVDGKVGELAFVHCADGRMLVRKAPVRTAAFTASELRNQSRFTLAIAYLKGLKANPAAYAVYKQAAKIRRKRACDLAVADFLNPPVINDVDLSLYTGKVGQGIQIEAVDKFEVKDVAVTITQADGVLLEQGAAVLEESTAKWHYATQALVSAGQTVVIQVTASDHAGHAVTKTFHQPLVA